MKIIILIISIALAGCTTNTIYPQQGFNVRYCGNASMVSALAIRNKSITLKESIKKYGGIVTTKTMSEALNGKILNRFNNIKRGDALLLNYVIYLHWVTVIKTYDDKVIIHDPIFGGKKLLYKSYITDKIISIVR